MPLYLFPQAHWGQLIAANGYWVVFAVIALESAGIPFPGEAVLIASAAYAGQTHRLDIKLLISLAALAGVFGSLCGYWIGSRAGLPLLRRYGRFVGIDERRMRLGSYVFDRYGGRMVLIGRFVSGLRALMSVLAGSIGCDQRRFFFFTTLGSIGWAVSFGSGAFFLGRDFRKAAGPIGCTTLVVAALVITGGWLFMRRHATLMQARADAAAGV